MTMTDRSVVHSTFVIERSYSVSPEKVFAAFSDSARKRRWFVEGETHDVEHYELDFRTGGTERARFRFREGTPVAGAVCSTETVHQDIVAGRRLVLASTMWIGPQCISAALVTIEFLPNGSGTDLICTHQGAFFEGSDGPEMRQHGWSVLFDRLAKELARDR